MNSSFNKHTSDPDMTMSQLRLTVPEPVVTIHPWPLHHDLGSIPEGRVRPAVRPALQIADIQVCKLVLRSKER